jgi:hypothetical protein
VEGEEEEAKETLDPLSRAQCPERFSAKIGRDQIGIGPRLFAVKSLGRLHCLGGRRFSVIPGVYTRTPATLSRQISRGALEAPRRLLRSACCRPGSPDLGFVTSAPPPTLRQPSANPPSARPLTLNSASEAAGVDFSKLRGSGPELRPVARSTPVVSSGRAARGRRRSATRARAPGNDKGLYPWPA